MNFYHNGRVTALHAAVSVSIPRWVEILIKNLPGTRRDGGAETQSLVSLRNIPGLNPKSLRNKYDVNTYVLLMLIRPSNGRGGDS